MMDAGVFSDSAPSQLPRTTKPSHKHCITTLLVLYRDPRGSRVTSVPEA